ncbi:hypothetical protein COEREDRAFT_85891 [Coemansia reversa NRRL 1564]|uniref:SAGA-associated factor 11 n=1 Tax=Coemansia reversa (strain ATCC 12441 / NRRL 1564) TaxID=763665 RepID=A0A2G5BFX1_COERN|nr:hypothetical protein COEREDRAFT_85891 [Coemansia reversa NRRL 1564]|eukprot:PIA17617.1 hypothetical protein COEREDRAFT_85891 [Coemansia reversa NRRL 1564]
MKPKTEGGDSAVFDELLQYYDSKIDMLRLARNSLETAKPAITPPSSPGDSDTETRSRALLALELYQEMIDELMMGVVFESHYEAKQSTAVCVLCNTQCQLNDSGNGNNNGASAGSQGSTDAFECPSCQRSFPAARFAAHMDKCMGLSSRRAATRRWRQTRDHEQYPNPTQPNPTFCKAHVLYTDHMILNGRKRSGDCFATCSRSTVNSTSSTPAHPAGSYDSSSEHSADRRRRLAKRGRRI